MDINILNSFLGYGDFRNADILVLSKHEGANNAYLNEVLDARINHFGLEKEYWIDETNRLNGYWHPSTEAGGEVMKVLGVPDYDGKVPFVVNYPSRILLALEEAIERNTDSNIHKWFDSLGNDSYAIKLKETFTQIYSYQQTTSLKAALSHYQPLPRQNGTWPYPQFSKADYENVFGNGEQPENPFFLSIRSRREELFTNLLKSYPKKLIFSTGNYQGVFDSLSNFFEREFDATFKRFRIGGDDKGLFGTFSYEGQKTVVVHTHGFANGGGLSLDDTRMITKRVFQLLKD